MMQDSFKNQATALTPMHKLFIAGSLSLLLNGCATGPKFEERRDVDVSFKAGCVTHSVTTDKSVPVYTDKQLEKIEAGKMEESAEKILSKIEEMSVNYDCRDYDMLAVLAKSELDNKAGAINSSAILLALSSENENIRMFVTQAMISNGLVSADLETRIDVYHEREALKDVNVAVANLQASDGHFDGADLSYFVEQIYTGEAYPDLEMDTAEWQVIVENAMLDTGLSIDEVNVAYGQYKAALPKACESGLDESGQFYSRCVTRADMQPN